MSVCQERSLLALSAGLGEEVFFRGFLQASAAERLPEVRCFLKTMLKTANKCQRVALLAPKLRTRASIKGRFSPCDPYGVSSLVGFS